MGPPAGPDPARQPVSGPLLRERLDPVGHARDAGHLRAVRAAKKVTTRFHAMTDDLAAAVFAGGRQRMDGALEAVEDVRFPGRDQLERLVVLVAADFTLAHRRLLRDRA